jgi:hypothetical protein
LYITLDTATKTDYILGQIADDATSTIPPITTTFTYSAEMTSTQITSDTPTPTNFSGGVMLFNRVGNNLYVYAVHTVANPTTITLHVGDPTIPAPAILLTLCSTAATCASPFSSTRLDASGNYLGTPIITYMNSYTDDGNFGQVFVLIKSNEYPLGEVRGQVSRTVTPTNPNGSGVSSTGSLFAGAMATACFSPFVHLFALFVAILAIRRA